MQHLKLLFIVGLSSALTACSLFPTASKTQMVSLFGEALDRINAAFAGLAASSSVPASSQYRILNAPSAWTYTRDSDGNFVSKMTDSNGKLVEHWVTSPFRSQDLGNASTSEYTERVLVSATRVVGTYLHRNNTTKGEAGVFFVLFDATHSITFTPNELQAPSYTQQVVSHYEPQTDLWTKVLTGQLSDGASVSLTVSTNAHPSVSADMILKAQGIVEDAKQRVSVQIDTVTDWTEDYRFNSTAGTFRLDVQGKGLWDLTYVKHQYPSEEGGGFYCPREGTVLDPSGKQIGTLALRNGRYRIDYDDGTQEEVFFDQIDRYINRCIAN